MTIDLAAPEDQQVVGVWGKELHNPHDVAIARSTVNCQLSLLSNLSNV